VALASNLKKQSKISNSQDNDTEDQFSKDESDRRKKIKQTRVQRELGK